MESDIKQQHRFILDHYLHPINIQLCPTAKTIQILFHEQSVEDGTKIAKGLHDKGRLYSDIVLVSYLDTARVTWCTNRFLWSWTNRSRPPYMRAGKA